MGHDVRTIERKVDLIFEAILHVAKAVLDEEGFEVLKESLNGVNAEYVEVEDGGAANS